MNSIIYSSRYATVWIDKFSERVGLSLPEQDREITVKRLLLLPSKYVIKMKERWSLGSAITYVVTNYENLYKELEGMLKLVTSSPERNMVLKILDIIRRGKRKAYAEAIEKFKHALTLIQPKPPNEKLNVSVTYLIEKEDLSKNELDSLARLMYDDTKLINSIRLARERLARKYGVPIEEDEKVKIVITNRTHKDYEASTSWKGYKESEIIFYEPFLHSYLSAMENIEKGHWPSDACEETIEHELRHHLRNVVLSKRGYRNDDLFFYNPLHLAVHEVVAEVNFSDSRIYFYPFVDYALYEYFTPFKDGHPIANALLAYMKFYVWRNKLDLEKAEKRVFDFFSSFVPRKIPVQFLIAFRIAKCGDLQISEEMIKVLSEIIKVFISKNDVEAAKTFIKLEKLYRKLNPLLLHFRMSTHLNYGDHSIIDQKKESKERDKKETLLYQILMNPEDLDLKKTIASLMLEDVKRSVVYTNTTYEKISKVISSILKEEKRLRNLLENSTLTYCHNGKKYLTQTEYLIKKIPEILNGL